MPASVTSNASAANTPSSVAVRRGAASASDRRSSRVCMFSTGWLGSTACTVLRSTLPNARRIAGRAHEHLAGKPKRRLRQRHVDLRDRLLRQAELPDVADDADHREPLRRRRLPGCGRSPGLGGTGNDTRLPIGSVPSQYFVIALLIDDDAHRFFGVEIVERAAAHQRNADRAEVLRARHADIRGRAALGIVDRRGPRCRIASCPARRRRAARRW